MKKMNAYRLPKVGNTPIVADTSCRVPSGNSVVARRFLTWNTRCWLRLSETKVSRLVRLEWISDIDQVLVYVVPRSYQGL